MMLDVSFHAISETNRPSKTKLFLSLLIESANKKVF